MSRTVCIFLRWKAYLHSKYKIVLAGGLSSKHQTFATVVPLWDASWKLIRTTELKDTVRNKSSQAAHSSGWFYGVFFLFVCLFVFFCRSSDTPRNNSTDSEWISVCCSWLDPTKEWPSPLQLVVAKNLEISVFTIHVVLFLRAEW